MQRDLSGGIVPAAPAPERVLIKVSGETQRILRQLKIACSRTMINSAALGAKLTLFAEHFLSDEDVRSLLAADDLEKIGEILAKIFSSKDSI